MALVGGAAFLFRGDDDRHADASGDTVSIDTGGLVNRNLPAREFVATYGNRADAQDRAIKALKEGQDRQSTRLHSRHYCASRLPHSARKQKRNPYKPRTSQQP